LTVQECGHVGRYDIILVDHGYEALLHVISENHVVSKSCLNESIYLCMELKDFFYKLLRVLLQLFISHDIFTRIQDVIVHMLDDVDSLLGIPIEKLVNVLQRICLLIIEHILEAGLFFHQILRVLTYHPFDSHSNALQLCLFVDVEPLVAAPLFPLNTDQGAVDILVDPEIIHEILGAILVVFIGRLHEQRTHRVFVIHDSGASPTELLVGRIYHCFGLLESHHCLEGIEDVVDNNSVDDFVVAIAVYRIEDRVDQLLVEVLANLSLEDCHALLGYLFGALLVKQIIVNIRENLVKHVSEHHKVVPPLPVYFQ